MESQESRGAGLGKAAAFAFGSVSLLVEKATQDGHLAAAARLGVDELSAALKAFPESIQAQEPGTLFNPTQGEVAAGRKSSPFGHHSPSAIVAGRHGIHGPDRERPAHRSPSEIADDRGGVHGPGPGNANDRDRDDGRER